MVLGGSCVGEAPSLPPARPSARSMTWPRNSSPLSAGSAANPSAWPQLRALGSIPVAPASVGALRHPRAPQGQRAAGFTARARAASSAVCNPAGEEGIAATSRPGGFQGGGPSRGCGAPSRRARARTRPHVSLRPRGMWVTEPSGLTCPRPPPPPQRPLCNAASRAGPANPRPRAAERKHSAHVARAAGPCEGGAGPAPPGRAAVMQGTGRATAGPPGGRRGPSPWQTRSAEQPTPPALGTLPAAVSPAVSRRLRAPPPPSPARRSLALTRIHLHGALGEGAEAVRFPQSGQRRHRLSAAPPRAGGSDSRGAPSWARRAGRPGPAARQRAAVRDSGGRRAALLAGSLTTKAAARRLPAASAPRQRGRLTGRAAATM